MNDIQVSTNIQMSQSLISLNDQFEQAASRNVRSYIEANFAGHQFTATEKLSMVKMEQLKLIGDLTLAEILLRGQVINEIEAQGLWSSHPMGFSSMEEAAEAQGISQSEYSSIRDLCNTIFPYLAAQAYNIADLWESIGKSKFRELIPLLMRAITDEESRSQRVEQIFENEMNDIFASAMSAGETLTDEAARGVLVNQLIEAGQLPVRELRQRLRPERHTSVPGYRLSYHNNQDIVMFIVDSDQDDLLRRRLRGYTDITPLSQEDASHLPELRLLRRYLLESG